ncbi:hypothetical protein [Pseudobacter ginsenosidimutans]|uniref:Uncharacterized protein n=1 Tax=Pseudobacter ginsenosidimutans TaxID=661488 RepID=A0A4Q7N5I2_9BACT|nr:hypothetical protein [Pseudobacter ginsenosidimutans]QEC44816.1 hypothetical protein FSB84_25205 [Pseudobacter ginsenosidimutans]RZS76306.1 hypothetical protein EV199_2187 [Pseudobacter ginsenosidimutans]
MKTCFMYDYYKIVDVPQKGLQRQNHLVVFFAYKDVLLNKSNIQFQFRSYFFSNTLPDKLIIICLDFNKNDVLNLFQATSDIYEYIPKFQQNPSENNIVIISIGLSGIFHTALGAITEAEIKEIYNRGLTNIFVENNGLIISRSAHHFVFPSGKHSDRFLRPGNVLLHGAQITFIASALLTRFKQRDLHHIYCDTSSINSLAYAYINLRKELGDPSNTSIHVESFGSYSLFEKSAFKAPRNSIFLISSSTSGSILRRMTRENAHSIELNDIAVIYGLGVESTFIPQVICDLKKDPNSNPEGLASFKSYNRNNGEICKFCEDKSVPIPVEGDVFLLEKPAVSPYLIKKSDLPTHIRNLSGYYRPNINVPAIFRVFYKENSNQNRKYELFIDLEALIDSWTGDPSVKDAYRSMYTKFEKRVIQSFPSSLKYIVTLSDIASKKLAELIVDILSKNGATIDRSCIIADDKLVQSVKAGQKGVIAVVSASVVTGRNLLFLSRALRQFENDYQRMFFTFMNRTTKQDSFEFLESNLGLGENGPGTYKITNVERIHCTQESIATPWHIETEFMKVLYDFCDEDAGQRFGKTLMYCQVRSRVLNDSGSQKGLDNELFHPSFHDKPLRINNGFAFAPTKDFAVTASQSEVYFIIASILNDIRNKGELLQTEYVRHLIDPGNFVRYNDGIIQACILRAAKDDELKYHLSEELSLQMKSILGDMILHLDDEHSEAIVEFFYAIAIKKLRLIEKDLIDCLELLEEHPIYKKDESVLMGIVSFIQNRVLNKKNVQKEFEDLPKVRVEEDTTLE